MSRIQSADQQSEHSRDKPAREPCADQGLGRQEVPRSVTIQRVPVQVNKPRGKEYQLQWRPDTDFVRLAGALQLAILTASTWLSLGTSIL